MMRPCRLISYNICMAAVWQADSEEAVHIWRRLLIPDQFTTLRNLSVLLLLLKKKWAGIQCVRLNA